jgi:hypothetical protein
MKRALSMCDYVESGVNGDAAKAWLSSFQISFKFTKAFGL